MKAKYILLIIFMISSIVNCDSTQPKPNGNGWDRCPKCEGYGYIIKSFNKNRNRIKDSEERDEYNEAINFFHKDPKHLEKAESDTQNYNSGDSGYKRNKTTCPKCNGKGWIKIQNFE